MRCSTHRPRITRPNKIRLVGVFINSHLYYIKQKSNHSITLLDYFLHKIFKYLTPEINSIFLHSFCLFLNFFKNSIQNNAETVISRMTIRITKIKHACIRTVEIMASTYKPRITIINKVSIVGVFINFRLYYTKQKSNHSIILLDYFFY